MPAVPSGSIKENKQPSTLSINHADAPDLANAGPGDEVHLHIHGHVKSNHAKDEFGDGHVQIDAHSIEDQGTKKKGVEPGKKKKNAAHMPIDELKEVIKAAEPKDKENVPE